MAKIFIVLQKVEITFGALSNCSILGKQYWPLHYCSPCSYRSSNFAIAKVVNFDHLASFLHWFCTLVHGFFSVLLPDSNSCLSFLLLKVKAKNNRILLLSPNTWTTIVIAIVGQGITSGRKIKKSSK